MFFEATIHDSTRVKVRFPCAGTHRENRRVLRLLSCSLDSLLRDVPFVARGWLASIFVRVFNARLESGKPFYKARNAAVAETNAKKSFITKATSGWVFSVAALYRESSRNQIAKTLADNAIVKTEVLKTDDYEGDLPFIYAHLAADCQRAGIEPPAIPDVEKVPYDIYLAAHERALLRLRSKRWYLRKLNRKAAVIRENVQIAIQNVGKFQPYVSKSGLSEWRAAQRASADFLGSFFLANDETGEEILLTLASEAGVSNPKNRNVELMVRAKGLHEYAEREGWEGYFVTATAPSKYHRNSRWRWNGATPKETNDYMAQCWVRGRARLAKHGITFKGIRIVEPHKDGTPHWHILFFCERSRGREAMRHLSEVFRAEDAHELKNKKRQDARFKAIFMDPEKGGGAIAYIAKYIAKNVDPGRLGVDSEDYEAGKKSDGNEYQASETIENVSAWKSIHGVRQFQFFGTESVTIWRELRRIKEQSEQAEIEQILKATGRNEGDKASWADFERLTDKFPVELVTETEIRGEFKDEARRILGVAFTRTGEFYNTRRGRWERKTLTPAKRSELTRTAGAVPRSRLNNCNPTTAGCFNHVEIGVNDVISDRKTNFTGPNQAQRAAIYHGEGHKPAQAATNP